jgi:hypothetical protein
VKQYVLEEPAAAGAPLAADPQSPPVESLPFLWPGWWRSFLLVIVLEPIALAILYVALNGVPSWGGEAPASGVAYVASFSLPRPAEAAPAAPEEPAADAAASRIAHERGRYVVELHAQPLGPVLAMLTKATKARVSGGGIFIGSPLLLTRSLVAASPREAWQAVFGDVANFAIACAGSACEVRFVSLLRPGSPEAKQDLAQAAPAEPVAPATAPEMAPPAQVAPQQEAAAAGANQNGEPAPSEN